MKTKRLNIAIMPNKEIFEYAIQVSSEFSKRARTLFTLDGKNFFPHITIYSPEFPEKNVLKVIKEVSTIITSKKRFLSEFTFPDKELGYWAINVRRNAKLHELHREILHKINYLRDGVLREKYSNAKYFDSLSEEKRSNILEFGYPNVLDQWVPHLTVTRFEDEEKVNWATKNYEWGKDSLSVESVGVFEMGKNGTCVKLLEKFDLARDYTKLE